MASMRNHKVIEVYRIKGQDTRYHVTTQDRVLKTTGPKSGGAKILFTTDDGKTFKTSVMPGNGRRATATEWKQNAPYFAGLERES